MSLAHTIVCIYSKGFVILCKGLQRDREKRCDRASEKWKENIKMLVVVGYNGILYHIGGISHSVVMPKVSSLNTARATDIKPMKCIHFFCHNQKHKYQQLIWFLTPSSPFIAEIRSMVGSLHIRSLFSLSLFRFHFTSLHLLFFLLFVGFHFRFLVRCTILHRTKDSQSQFHCVNSNEIACKFMIILRMAFYLDCEPTYSNIWLEFYVSAPTFIAV